MPNIPDSPGVYFQNAEKAWVGLPKARILKSKLTGTGLFVETGGYTNLGTDVVCEGEKAPIRIQSPRPTLYVRGLSAPEDVLIIRLTKKKNTRTFYKSSANSTVENKIGARKSDIKRTAVTEVSDGLFSFEPEANLSPGEYLLVAGDPENSFDFGIDANQ